MFSDEHFMQRCIDLARNGLGQVAPNPLVGALLVLDNRILAEGYHTKYGEAHAEVEVLKQVTDPSTLQKSTLYVSLEPCAHFGKTPPCVDLILEKKIKRVVIGCRDSFAEVDGKGIEKLRNAGVELSLGVLEKECRELNKRFFTFHEKKRPYIVLKWAQTQDGFIDRERVAGERPQSNRISCPESQSLVHQWRSQEQAILVGKNTVLNDNPALTVRHFEGNNPLRLILDSQLEIPSHFQVFDKSAPTWVLNRRKEEQQEQLAFRKLPDLSPASIVRFLHQQNIQSVFIEGGAQTLQGFIDSHLWDEARILQSPTSFGSGLQAPLIPQLPQHTRKFFADQIHFIYHS